MTAALGCSAYLAYATLAGRCDCPRTAQFALIPFMGVAFYCAALCTLLVARTDRGFARMLGLGLGVHLTLLTNLIVGRHACVGCIVVASLCAGAVAIELRLGTLNWRSALAWVMFGGLTLETTARVTSLGAWLM